MRRTGRQDRPEQSTVHPFPGCKAEATVRLSAAPGNRWGVILAGGDGVRLQPLTRLICGDSRPKQFCPIVGTTSLLEQTMRRVEPIIPEGHTVVSLTAHHEQWYSKEEIHTSQRIIQPLNRGTAPPIVHSLLSIACHDPGAVVAVVPSDHYFSDEPLFQRSLETAFQSAVGHSDSVVLLGARPDYPEVEYGWIEPHPVAAAGRSDIHRVKDFWEKPSLDVARSLLLQGSLWNTFVMVGSVQAFLQLVTAALPELLAALASVELWQGRQALIDGATYGTIPSTNFSQSVLSADPGRLLVLRLPNVGWSYLGEPGRAVSTACATGWHPEWLQAWSPSKTSAKELHPAEVAVA